MRVQASTLKSLVAALVSGALATTVITLAGAPRAEESSPAASLPTTEIPYYAEWASSPHARRDAEPFNHWNKEGNIPVTCARCHSTPGFLDYLGADGTAAGVVDHPAPIGTVITCVARATAGLGDDAVEPKLQFINVHYAAAGATLYGAEVRVGYEYTGKSYAGRFQHRAPYNHCTGCHETHTVEIKFKDCAACHREVSDKASLHRIRTSTIDRDGNGDVNEGIAQEIEHLRDRLTFPSCRRTWWWSGPA